jgi:UDP-glucuronate 4-epimerase
MKRDFTYIDDIINGITRIIDKVPSNQKTIYSASNPPYKIYNIGNNSPVTLNEFITAIEDACSKKALKNLLPMQPGDVPITFADIDDLIKDVGFKPSTTIQDGIKKFVSWYLHTQQSNL